MTMNRDLEELARVAKNAQELRTRSSMSLGGGRNKIDLGDPSKWSLSDSPQFGQVMKLYEKDLEYLDTEREKQRQKLKEIQSDMLKAGTRKEEIARFNRAKDDKEFAKMLRARTLGPEHSETQTQLRKSIRTIRDRVQKLEKRLQDDKKKLSQAQSCKPAFRSESLPTFTRNRLNSLPERRPLIQLIAPTEISSSQSTSNQNRSPGWPHALGS
ncbi:hypothetical protein NLJ89_g12357 [Agrocybe chaxingu]|uniref:Uncharacterized protein n=1 Tax=Agrocybe chaxingu TaxID=84603 RepID=A0A9W8MP55_9AGAR|nr:hypothetical protein NLJ89_g12357 [Agrocybe chaxingu]